MRDEKEQYAAQLPFAADASPQPYEFSRPTTLTKNLVPERMQDATSLLASQMLACTLLLALYSRYVSRTS